MYVGNTRPDHEKMSLHPQTSVKHLKITKRSVIRRNQSNQRHRVLFMLSANRLAGCKIASLHSKFYAFLLHQPSSLQCRYSSIISGHSAARNLPRSCPVQYCICLQEDSGYGWYGLSSVLCSIRHVHMFCLRFRLLYSQLTCV